jgi:Zn-dependent peptidase ImmA (M78 family)
MVRVPVKPELIQWAIDRSKRDPADLAARFDKLDDWLQGTGQPTLSQLEKFAAATRAPVGYFFLEEPPEEPLPIPDFRTVGSGAIAGGGRPSPDLLDTIYLCQQRQDWYRSNAQVLREDPVAFIGSATVQSDPAATANAIRVAVGFDLIARAEARTFEDALRMMIRAADDAGILVMVSGIVGQNTHRPLKTEEFRGFALSDEYAPLVFVNGADTKAGQMFTLAHEFAHLWLGQTALTDATAATVAMGSRNAAAAGLQVERWCNAVAAEVLVPMESFRAVYRPEAELHAEKRRLSSQYKVSTLVILRRIYDVGGLPREAFWSAYNAEAAHLRSIVAARKAQSEGGGDPYATGRVRVSPRFARAVLAATWEGRATFTEAFRMLGFKSVKKLEAFGDTLGMSQYLRQGAV